MEQQKEVKIIGLKINEQMGILQSCEMQFDPNNHLIAIKGEVGSGKTTMQKALMLATQGSETLKDDKSLYGTIDEEVQLLDGDKKVFIGCKTNVTTGSLDYVIYTKDDTGKKVNNPVIDGVKQTPATYLKELQTALTWRMDELMSENQTVQKKILLELYKSALAKLGVVYDKKSLEYSSSILGKIEQAEQTRSEKEFLRKQVGGFQNQLEPLGIDVHNESTFPVYNDITHLEARRNKLQYDIDNIGQQKESKLKEIENEATSIALEVKEWNRKAKEENAKRSKTYQQEFEQYKENEDAVLLIIAQIKTLQALGVYTDSAAAYIETQLKSEAKNTPPQEPELKEQILFDEVGRIATKHTDHSDEVVCDLLRRLETKKLEYSTLKNAPAGDTAEIEKELQVVMNEIILAKENNKKVEMLLSYLSWEDANKEVVRLRDEYASMLASVDTGVEGLVICVDKEDSGLSIYLTYDGSYDTEYFSNPNKEARKLSSYSGTQKPLICLLLQNYLLSKKPKALRYLFIDNVPIDNKTKKLLNKMGEELGLTIIVNITGDFSKESLESGEVLIEGGEVFFNVK